MGRLLLALWVLSIPGFWLANLLIKPALRLPEGLPLRFCLALAVAYAALFFRPLLSLSGSAYLCVLLGLGVALIYTFHVPRTTPGPRLSEGERATARITGFLAMSLCVFHLGWGDDGNLQSLFEDPGSLAGAWVDLLAHMSSRETDSVIAFLPTFTVPLVFLATCLLGWVVTERRFMGLVAGALGGVFLVNPHFAFWGGDLHRLVIITLWSSMALLLDGFEDSHPLHIPAWALLVLAAVGTHIGVLPVLLTLLLLLGLRTLTSFRRFQEGFPFFLAYVLPAAILVGVLCLVRLGELGGLSLSTTPSPVFQDALEGRLALNPAVLPWGIGVLGVLFVPVFFKQCLDQGKTFYLVGTGLLLFALGYTPWGIDVLDALWASHISLLPWFHPVPVTLAALLYWSVWGLQRSRGLVWLRITYVVLLAALLVKHLVDYFTP